jgi:oligopeptide/dipeptide ABC transporter ATP-binding protein
MAAVQHLADRIAVMYRGQLVEVGDAAQVFADPIHPYTRMLLAAIPRPGADPTEAAASRVDATAPTAPGGCHFAPRCVYATPLCSQQVPDLLQHDGASRLVRCHRVGELPPVSVAPEAEPAPIFIRRLEIMRRSAGASH